MTIFLLANSVFIVGSVIYGWLAGNRHDREGVVWITAAIAGTLLVQTNADRETQILLIKVIDAALLIAMVSLALRSGRYWPTWFAGFHLVTVVVNTALIVSSEVDMISSEVDMLRVIGAFFAIPAILAMVIGIYLDRLAERKDQLPTL